MNMDKLIFYVARLLYSVKSLPVHELVIQRLGLTSVMSQTTVRWAIPRVLFGLLIPAQ
jgi:hypothetical protein